MHTVILLNLWVSLPPSLPLSPSLSPSLSLSLSFLSPSLAYVPITHAHVCTHTHLTTLHTTIQPYYIQSRWVHVYTHINGVFIDERSLKHWVMHYLCTTISRLSQLNSCSCSTIPSYTNTYTTTTIPPKLINTVELLYCGQTRLNGPSESESKSVASQG